MKKAFLIAVVSICSCVIKANSTPLEDLQHLKARASFIVVGQVLSQPKGKPRDYHELIDFAFELNAIQFLKGAKPASDKLWVLFTSPNYHLKNRKLGGPWNPPVKVGERYVFFLQNRGIIGIRPYSQQLARRL